MRQIEDGLNHECANMPSSPQKHHRKYPEIDDPPVIDLCLFHQAVGGEVWQQ